MRKLFLIATMLAFSATGVWAQTGGDECDVADVITISGFDTYAIAMDSTTATSGSDPVPVIPCGAFIGIFNQDIWFSFVPDADGAIDVTTCDPTSWDTDLALYDGSAGCAALLELNCSGDAPGNAACQIFYSEFENPTAVFAGVTYYLRVGGWNAVAAGVGTMNMNFYAVGAEICDDGADNDADGLIDCFDPDCAGIPPCGAEAGQCDDGVDNDADGTTDCFDVDCIGDPACFEGDAATCTDGVDNDADGATDCADLDCSGIGLCGPEICDDGFDNDGDGLIDCFDVADCLGTPACPAAGNDECIVAVDIPIAGPGTYTVLMDSTTATLGADPLPGIACAVGGAFDNDIWFSFTPDQDMSAEIHTCDATSWDTDLLVYEDAFNDCTTMTEIACNGDAGILTGCQAYYSHVQLVGVTAGVNYKIRVGSWAAGASGAGQLTINLVAVGPEICDDGIDNDLDGLIDCLDPDCNGAPNCFEGDSVTCSDGIDNDGDGATDCADADCSGIGLCGPEICDDGFDNDGDGLVDCLDIADCLGTPACPISDGDECSIALEVFDGANAIDTNPYTSSADISNAGLCPATFFGVNDMDGWYLYTATADAFYEIHTCDPAGFDSDLLIYDFTAAGGDCANIQGNEIACNGDSTVLLGPCQAFYSHVEVPLVAGNQYLIRVGAWAGGGGGTGTLSIVATLCPPVLGLGFTSDCVSGDVTLNWTAGTYDAIEILRDQVLIDTLGGGDTTYTDPGLAAGNYFYQVQGVCAGNLGASATTSANVASYGGESDVIFGVEGVDQIDSVAALQAALDANGIIYVTTSQGPADWGCLGSTGIARVWMMSGTWPNDYRITDADGTALAAAVENGTSVYFEAADHWGYFHIVTGYDNYDGVDQSAVVDGDDSFLSMNGADSGFGLDTSDLSGTAYNQAAAAIDYTDQINVLAGTAGPNAALIWTDAVQGYGTGIFYATDAPYGNTISQSWEFGGFGGDQVDLAARYIAALGGGGPVGALFGRGDCNADGGFNIADTIFLLAALFSGGPAGPCLDACDANGDGSVNIADAIFSLASLFSGGPPPSDPAPTDCGVDGDDSDTLDCANFPPCP